MIRNFILTTQIVSYRRSSTATGSLFLNSAERLNNSALTNEIWVS